MLVCGCEFTLPEKEGFSRTVGLSAILAIPGLCQKLAETILLPELLFHLAENISNPPKNIHHLFWVLRGCWELKIGFCSKRPRPSWAIKLRELSS